MDDNYSNIGVGHDNRQSVWGNTFWGKRKKKPYSLGIVVSIQQNKYKHWMEEINRLINKLQTNKTINPLCIQMKNHVL